MANKDNSNEMERPRIDTENENLHDRPIKRPFDTSGMNWVPETREDDPPYRDWWVVGREQDDE